MSGSTRLTREVLSELLEIGPGTLLVLDARSLDVVWANGRARQWLSQLGPDQLAQIPAQLPSPSVDKEQRIVLQLPGGPAELGLRRLSCSRGLLLGQVHGPDQQERAMQDQLLALQGDNQRLRRELQEAIRTREEFLSVASHELRAPLTPLQLQIQMLLRSVRKGPAENLSPDRLLEKLTTCERHSKRLGKLIHDLLDVSRITAGRLNLDLEEVEISGAVRDVVARLQAEPERAHSGSDLELQVDGSCTGLWDRTRLDQVVTNLIVNAIQYGRGNPIRIRLESVHDAAGAEQALLEVADQGIGIEQESLERIFERFERATAVRNQGGGLGLGLYIVRQILEAMGGRIRVRSQLGVGSTFTVELPCRALRAEDGQRATEASP